MINKKKILHNKPENKRRVFLKKALYIAPTLIVLGQLSKPTAALAKYGTDDPFGASAASSTSHSESGGSLDSGL